MRDMIEIGSDGLWFEDSGGDGEPVVLLHPGIADMRVWDMVWGPLTETHRVIRFDARGYGGSTPATEEYDWVSDLLAVMDRAGLSSAHLVGNSNGGAVALALAATLPERVRSMVLLAPGISGFEYAPEPELEERAAELDPTDQSAVLQFMLDLWCAAGQEPFVRELVAGAATVDGQAAGLWRPLPDVWEDLSSIQTPTVIMVGDRDPASMIAGCEAAADRLPHASLMRLAGVDHLPQVRVPDLVVETVRTMASS